MGIFLSVLTAALTSWPFWLLFLSVVAFWSWFAVAEMQRLQNNSQKVDFGFLRSPYAKTMLKLREGIPKLLLPKVSKPGQTFWKHAEEVSLGAKCQDIEHQQSLRNNPWSWPVLDLALRIAFYYPVVLALFFWAAKYPTGFGETALFPENTEDWIRWAAFSTMALLMAASLAAKIYAGKVERVVDIFFGVILACVVILSAIGAISSPFGGWLTESFETTAAGSFALALSVGGAAFFVSNYSLPVTMALAGGFAFGRTIELDVLSVTITLSAMIFGIATNILSSWFPMIKGKRRSLGLLAYASLIFAILACGFNVLQYLNQFNITLAVFLILLPIVNAIFDYLSYGTTLKLLEFGWLKYKDGKFLWSFIAGLLDIFAALIFFAVLSMALLATLHFANLSGGRPLFDIGGLLQQLLDDHWQVPWVIAMVGSTLLPTMLHLGLAAFSLLTYAPTRRWDNYIRSSDAKEFGGKSIYYRIRFPVEAALLTMLPVTIFGAMGWALWTYGGFLVDLYVNTIWGIASRLDLV